MSTDQANEVDPAKMQELNRSETNTLDDRSVMRLADEQISHIWMVRTFLKHSDEATTDEELADVHRELYDYMLALGPSLDQGDAASYLKIARKKFSKLRRAMETFSEIQPEVSGHMNFKMSAASLRVAVSRLAQILGQPG